ncbi:MAG: outer membrane protein transport protein [Natronohydrobacter sp.]|nr:outer membrane protein transport protein [Natronohydrobacter sp.]
MRKTLATGLVALATTPAFAPAFAGGIERNPQSMAILFQQGNYVEFGASHARPRVTGDVFGLGFASGNIANRFSTGSFAFKGDINEQLSYAVILDQPFGADTLYPTVSPLGGALGKINNTMLTGVLRYKFDGGFSAHAGLRSSWTSGQVGLPALPPTLPVPYTMSTNTDQAWGYLVGVAYEKPEIALRVALTYNSSIKHSLTPSETLGGAPIPVANPAFNVKLPESVNLEFQSGVAPDTLVFGSVRWVKWKDFVIPAPALGSNLVVYPKNSVTYTLGVGRRFNETWSGSVSLSHDTGNGNPTSNLSPIGKRNTIGLGVSYTQDAMTISGGVQYTRIGSATTTLGSQFGKNSAIGAGIRIGYRF